MSWDVIVAGGGPAGMMLGFLLARSGIKVVVLEKHGDFLRDFRGDTVHPSTLEIMHELGLLDEFLRRPHQKARQVTVYFGEEPIVVADFSHLPTRCKFIALMPQWDFLDFLASHAKKFPTFQLEMSAQVTSLIEEDGKVVGVRGTGVAGKFEHRAPLVIGADGRSSVLRTAAGLEIIDRGAPIDVLWMRLPRKKSDPEQPMGRIRPGRLFVLFDRGDYWQSAYVIPKGEFENIKLRGLPWFRGALAETEPMMADRVDSLKTWDDVKLLTVKVDYLKKWYREGFLCIGDAAHAMSPIGGVGINLAIQDAVAAANILIPPIKDGTQVIDHLEAVQRRRTFPTAITQRAQVFIADKAIMGRFLKANAPLTPPLAVRLIQQLPFLSRIPARAFGVGIRPEHIDH